MQLKFGTYYVIDDVKFLRSLLLGRFAFGFILLVIFSLSCASVPDSTEADEEQIETSQEALLVDKTVAVEVEAKTKEHPFDWEKTFVSGWTEYEYSARGEECCTTPGQITDCWLADARDDRVTCERDSQCPSDSCDQVRGLCRCDTDADCNDGICTAAKICGPSWCNGYRMCSCWGGCDKVSSFETLCVQHGMSCCEGSYPIHPDRRARSESGVGYCSSCDDHNDCTQDKCDMVGNCIHVPLDITCDDNDLCTENDSCSTGRCRGEPVVCDDNNTCTNDSCDGAVGCVFENNTDSCSDGNACTVNDVCSDGACLPGSPRNCDDGNQCTEDYCDSATGCYYVLSTGACDDGNACTAGETCSLGVCGGGVPVNCDDGNICTDDSCDSELGCVYVNNTNACNDLNACTLNDVCTNGVCEGTEELSCDDGNPCTNESCNPSMGCVYVNNNEPCDDGDPCSFNETCSGGACVGTPMVCEDNNYCTDNVCTPWGCQYPYNESYSCPMANKCAANTRCSVGECAETLIYWRFEQEDPDDPTFIKDWLGNHNGRFENVAYSAPGGKVGRGARFDPGGGSNVGKAVCDYHPFSNVHSIGMWVKFDNVLLGNKEQIIGSTGGAGKSFYLGIDGDNQIFAGYGNDFVGKSKPSVPSTISAGVWARMVMTHDGTHAHVYVNGVKLISWEAGFVGGGLGTVFFLGTSQGNVMIDEVVIDERHWNETEIALDYDNGNGPNPFLYLVDCNDNNPCTYDTCHKDVGCINIPNTDPCDDGNACTQSDVCTTGYCFGTPVNCNDDNPCTDDSCDPVLGCVYTNNTAMCDDGNACTANDVCSDGVCGGEAITCNDGNVCTTDTCNSASGCLFANNSDTCDDGNVCTENDVCGAGICSGTALSCDDGNACTWDSCVPGTGCVHEPVDSCVPCENDGDCESSGLCPADSAGCAAASCVSGSCVCDIMAEATSCASLDTSEYPENCFDGFCDGTGICMPVMKAAEHNLCSDLFDPADPTMPDETSYGWLGSFDNTQTSAMLTRTGSTLCANNNYYAGGNECTEHTTGARIGHGGPDLVYAFSYQTNRIDQYELYSYIIKVQADFDVGIYIKSDIESASDCPEGNNPHMDEHAQTFLQVASERCAYPFKNYPMPPVVEDECRDNGNTLYGQDCCDPCVEGATCGYKWCKRGYNYNGTTCDMCQGAGGPDYDPMTHKGNCAALWTYPDNPHDCSSELPVQSGYEDYNYVASAVISPHGATDGSTRTVFVFVDGVTSDRGNFYLTVEKRRWWAGPCDRVADDSRVYDLTNSSSYGDVFLGTLEGTVNSVHGGSGSSCGGYDCNTFSGRSTCHASGTANAFWPNQEWFKIHRQTGRRSSPYCVISDESISGGADLVTQLYQASSTSLTICDASYSSLGCARNNSGSNIKYEFTADEGILYLLGVSRYQVSNRVCTPSAGDTCRYKLSVYSGPCPAACRAPSTWYSGSVSGTFTVNGTGFAPSAVISGNTTSSSNSYDPGAGGWDGRDLLYQINVTKNSRVRFSGCAGNGGSGSFNGLRG